MKLSIFQDGEEPDKEGEPAESGPWSAFTPLSGVPALHKASPMSQPGLPMSQPGITMSQPGGLPISQTGLPMSQLGHLLSHNGHNEGTVSELRTDSAAADSISSEAG